MEPNKIPINTNSNGITPQDPTDFSDVENEIRARFELLPEDIQKVLISSEYQMKLFEIAKAQKITYEQLGALEIETSMVLLGMTPPDDFREDIKNQLGIDTATTDSLVQKISEQVFLPIRQSIEKIYTAKEKVENAVLDSLSSKKVETETESDTLKNAGVEILDANGNTVGAGDIKQNPNTIQNTERGAQNIPAPTINLAGTGSQLPITNDKLPVGTENAGSMNRDDLLKSIENPPAGASASFLPKINKIVPPPTTQNVERGTQNTGTQNAERGAQSVSTQNPKPTIPTVQVNVTPSATPLTGIQQITRSTPPAQTTGNVPIPSQINQTSPRLDLGSASAGATASTPTTLSEQKFVAPMNMPKHETDYTIKPVTATGTSPSTPPHTDPYREIPQ